MFFSPLEQFEVVSLVSIFSFRISNVFYLLIFISILFYFFFSFPKIKIKQKSSLLLIPTRYQYLVERLIFFVKELIVNNIGAFYIYFLPFLLLLFLFIAFSNVLGMIPYSFTVTSHLIFTFYLSFICFFFVNFLGISLHGIKFIGLFLPNGAPFVLLPFLFLIEILSYVARVFSLAIRLFANMMSGHTLLKILSEFGWVLLTGLGATLFISIFPILIIFAVGGLELAIAFLQAYVFLILVCIYLNDAIHLH